MKINTETAVVTDWFNYQASRNALGDAFDASAEKKRFWWAVEQIMDWTRYEPERSWATIVEIWTLVDHDDLTTLAVLGAGEVEDLLCNYGEN
jgi:hypothetical protein